MKRRGSLRLRDDASLRVVAIADTHGSPHPDAVAHIAALKPDAILHAGDIGERAVLARFEALAPVYAVRGNIDECAAELPDLLVLDVAGTAGTVLRVVLMHIGVAGPRLRADAGRLARAEQASLVVCGHSHVPFIGQEHGLTVFNPGSIGPRRFQLPIVFGVIEVKATGVSLRHVDCETGRRWEP